MSFVRNLTILAIFANTAVAQTTTTLSVTNAAVTFNFTIGAIKLPVPQTIAVKSTPAGVTFTVATTGPLPHRGAWLLLSASAGRAPPSLTAQVNPTGLQPALTPPPSR